jgi:predicted ABC-type ATPase
MMKEKNLYIIAGCNGAGKTTASFTLLPEILDCKEFVNADEIAKGLSPFQPEKVSFEAGRIMLNRITELLSQNDNSEGKHELIAEMAASDELNILNKTKFNELKSYL